MRPQATMFYGIPLPEDFHLETMTLDEIEDFEQKSGCTFVKTGSEESVSFALAIDNHLGMAKIDWDDGFYPLDPELGKAEPAFGRQLFSKVIEYGCELLGVAFDRELCKWYLSVYYG